MRKKIMLSAVALLSSAVFFVAPAWDMNKLLKQDAFSIMAVEQEDTSGVAWVDTLSQAVITGTRSRTDIRHLPLTVTVVDPLWRKDVSYVLTERYDGGAGLDFPHDFPHDFGYSNVITSVNNTGFRPADALIRVYGPVDRCTVTVAGNEYIVSESLEEGEYVTVDTYARTVEATRLTGEVENAFQSVGGDYFEGSGSYIFERVPVGLSEVVWSGTSDLDITLVLTRDEPDYADLLGVA